jgi:hypothetical protein
MATPDGPHAAKEEGIPPRIDALPRAWSSLTTKEQNAVIERCVVPMVLCRGCGSRSPSHYDTTTHAPDGRPQCPLLANTEPIEPTRLHAVCSRVYAASGHAARPADACPLSPAASTAKAAAALVDDIKSNHARMVEILTALGLFKGGLSIRAFHLERDTASDVALVVTPDILADTRRLRALVRLVGPGPFGLLGGWASLSDEALAHAVRAHVTPPHDEKAE